MKKHHRFTERKLLKLSREYINCDSSPVTHFCVACAICLVIDTLTLTLCFQEQKRHSQLRPISTSGWQFGALNTSNESYLTIFPQSASSDSWSHPGSTGPRMKPCGAQANVSQSSHPSSCSRFQGFFLHSHEKPPKIPCRCGCHKNGQILNGFFLLHCQNSAEDASDCLLHKCKQIPKLKEKKQDEQKDSENRMKERRLVKKVYINNAAPIKTTILTGEKITILKKTVWVASWKVIFACKRDWQTNSSYSDLFTGRYFLRREGNEPASHRQSDFKLPVSRWPAPVHSCRVEGRPVEACADGGSCSSPARMEALLALLVGEGLYWATMIASVGTLPGSTKGRGVGFLSENVYHRVTALCGGGETCDMKELPEAGQRMSWSWHVFRALVSGAVRTGGKSICAQGWAGTLRAPWILL